MIYLVLKYKFNTIVRFRNRMLISIDDYAKDGGEELFTKIHCVLFPNP